MQSTKSFDNEQQCISATICEVPRMPRSIPQIDARTASLHVLHTLAEGCPIQEALSALRARFELSVQDQSLLQELCYGVLRTEDRLKDILTHYLPNTTRLPAPLLNIFLLALYQILFLERIPDHAIVATAVQDAKKRFGKALGNLTNALLRNLLRDREALLHPAWYRRDSDPKNEQVLHALARFYSLPFWLLNYWHTAYGFGNALNLAQRSFAKPAIGLFFQKHNDPLIPIITAMPPEQQTRVSSQGFALTPHAYRALCLRHDMSHLHATGRISYLSPGSQAVLQHLGVSTWERPIWDMCAGFGGKSAFAATFGVPIALCTDTSWKRLSSLAADFSRRHLPIPPRILADAANPPLRTFSGNILLDAPCSGLGILARRPDIRRKRQKKRSLRLFPPQQRALLQSALRFLQTNSFLAYCTCTLNPQENADLIRAILVHSNVELEYEWQTPHNDRVLEGMYGALLRRKR